MEPVGAQVSREDKPRSRLRSSSDPEGRKRRDRRKKEGKTDSCQLEKSKGGEEGGESAGGDPQVYIQISNCDLGEKEVKTGGEEEVRVAEEQPPASEASDSCRSDSHVLTSPSSDSLDALEEDDLLSCSSSAIPPPAASHPHAALQLHHHPHRHAQPHLLAPPPPHSHPLIQSAPPEGGGGGGGGGGRSGPRLLAPVCVRSSSGQLCSSDSSLCFAELSQLVDLLPSPPEASEDDEVPDLGGRKVPKEPDDLVKTTGDSGSAGGPAALPSTSSLSSSTDCVFNFDRGDARCYYNLCSNITPDSARSLPHPHQHPAGEWETGTGDLECVPILQPPPGFGDSSSEDEFFDARDRFTSPEDPTSGAKPRGAFLSWPCSLLLPPSG